MKRHIDCAYSTSPSVYVAYQALTAATTCSHWGNYLEGSTYDNTIGYDPEALSMYTAPSALQNAIPAPFAAINYTELDSFDPQKTAYVYSLPSGLSSIDPAWRTCLPLTLGAMDPPKALGKATAMVAPATAPMSTASPGHKATQAVAEPTLTPTINKQGDQKPQAGPPPSATKGFDQQKQDAPSPRSGQNDLTKQVTTSSGPRQSKQVVPSTEPVQNDPAKHGLLSPAPGESDPAKQNPSKLDDSNPQPEQNDPANTKGSPANPGNSIEPVNGQ